MHLNILHFLKILETEVTARGQLLDRVRQEIATYRDVTESLAAIPGGTDLNIPTDRIKTYLENLELIAEKIKYTHLTLFVLKENELEPEINKSLIRLLKSLNNSPAE